MTIETYNQSLHSTGKYYSDVYFYSFTAVTVATTTTHHYEVTLTLSVGVSPLFWSLQVHVLTFSACYVQMYDVAFAHFLQELHDTPPLLHHSYRVSQHIAVSSMDHHTLCTFDKKKDELCSDKDFSHRKQKHSHEIPQDKGTGISMLPNQAWQFLYSNCLL